MSTYTHRLAAAAVAPHPAAFGELSPISRARTTEVLSRLLIELLDITLCVRHANWNARGPDFLLLSDLLEEAGAKLDEQANRLARRIRALGGVAHATAHTIATESSFKPYPIEVSEGQDHLKALALRLGLLSAEARLSLHELGGMLDPTTADVVVDANRAIDDVLWQVECNLLKAR